MRQTLVDAARKRKFQKHGGDAGRDTLDEAMLVSREPDVELLALNEALDRLEQMDQRKRAIVELRFFAGCSIEETAEALEISTDTVKREWNKAKVWLLSEITGAKEARNGSADMGAD